MKNVKTKIGMVLGSLLAAMIFMACEVDSGAPDRDTIKATYTVDVDKVLHFNRSNRRFCMTEDIYYDAANSTSDQKNFLGTGYVVVFSEWDGEYNLLYVNKYEDDSLVCSMEPWKVDTYISVDESGSKVNFDSFTVKVHNETFSNNYMINVSCTNADKAQAL